MININMTFWLVGQVTINQHNLTKRQDANNIHDVLKGVDFAEDIFSICFVPMPSRPRVPRHCFNRVLQYSMTCSDRFSFLCLCLLFDFMECGGEILSTILVLDFGGVMRGG